MRAAALRERRLPTPDSGTFWEEIESWTNEELNRELEELLLVLEDVSS
jgi:hypothetical protein